MTEKSNNIAGIGILSAVAASLCCITPVLALISGTSGIASTFSWLESFRIYLIGFTVLVLGFAWYQKLKPRTAEQIECDCEEDKKPSFMQAKTFLGIVTVFTILMIAFPYYSSALYPSPEKKITIAQESNIETIDVAIKGMTCTSCEQHVNHIINQLSGISSIITSYESGNAIIEYDKSKTTIEAIEKAVNSTGYSVTSIKEK